MRKVIIPEVLWEQLAELKNYLVVELKLSERAAEMRLGRLREKVLSLRLNADYAPCRFERWRKLGYHCLPCEGWIFAYQSFDEGVIVRDMVHGSVITN